MNRDLQNVIGGALLLAALGVFLWWSIKMGVAPRPRFLWSSKAVFRESSPNVFWTRIAFYGVVMLVFLWITVASLYRLLSQR